MFANVHLRGGGGGGDGTGHDTTFGGDCGKNRLPV